MTNTQEGEKKRLRRKKENVDIIIIFKSERESENQSARELMGKVEERGAHLLLLSSIEPLLSTLLLLSGSCLVLLFLSLFPSLYLCHDLLTSLETQLVRASERIVVAATTEARNSTANGGANRRLEVSL